jgi:hypothetical protein
MTPATHEEHKAEAIRCLIGYLSAEEHGKSYRIIDKGVNAMACKLCKAGKKDSARLVRRTSEDLQMQFDRDVPEFLHTPQNYRRWALAYLQTYYKEYRYDTSRAQRTRHTNNGAQLNPLTYKSQGKHRP